MSTGAKVKPIFKEVRRTISVAEVLAANTSPVNLVTVGANQVIIPIHFMLTRVFGGVQYTVNTEYFFRVGLIQVSPSGATIGGSGDVAITLNPLQISPTIGGTLNWWINTGNPVGGNSIIKVRAWYKMVNM